MRAGDRFRAHQIFQHFQPLQDRTRHCKLDLADGTLATFRKHYILLTRLKTFSHELDNIRHVS